MKPEPLAAATASNKAKIRCVTGCASDSIALDPLGRTCDTLDMIKLTLSLVVAMSAASTLPAADYAVHTFRKIQLTDEFWAEGANYGDFNHDGKMDVVYGPFWWEGPDFKMRHELYAATKTSTIKKPDGTEAAIRGYKGALSQENDYADNFFTWTHDVNADGWDDVLVVGMPGTDLRFYENPKGAKNADGSEHWPLHKVFPVVDNESPVWGDIDGDGKPDVVCNSGGHLGYIKPNWVEPTKAWTFVKISPKGQWQRYSHGIGFGDVNGDGRMDLLEQNAWWEQPASLAGEPVWAKRDWPFAPGPGAAQMYAYDFNGDRLNDVLTTLNPHGYGLVWYEQQRDGDAIRFKQQVIMNKKPGDNRYGVKFSQPHAIELVDMDGDGVLDVLTGKRFWAHGPKGDVEPNAPALLYWFRTVREAGGRVDFVPYQIDNDSGVGTQVVAGDVNGDKLPDVVVGNKKGMFVFIHEKKTVSKPEWEQAQPKPLAAVTR
jgi:hypothetical protein